MSRPAFSDETLERIAQQLLPMDTEFTENERSDLEKVAWDWFQTNDSFCEPRRRTEDDDDKAKDALNEARAQMWMENPREYSVADCEECDWVMGGWLTPEKAAGALKTHVKNRHGKK